MNIIIIDDELNQIEALCNKIENLGHKVYKEQNISAGLKRIENNLDEIDVVMLDNQMPGFENEKLTLSSGKDLGRYLSENKKYENLYIIMVTGRGTEDLPKEVLLEFGFHEYLTKDSGEHQDFILKMILTRAQRFVNLQREKRDLQRQKEKRWFDLIHKLDAGIKFENYDRIIQDYIGKSDQMLQILEYCERYAKTDLPVLITGESGTGKEVIAKIIKHICFPKDSENKEMISVNCSAIHKDILESELFGHKKGAFTGAIEDKKGHFENASGGILFLDEIGDLSLSAQAKILRAIQEKKIVRVGESKDREINVKLILATHMDLTKLIEDGKFRSDLYYRIQGMFPKLPKLIDRGRNEIERLINIFQDEFKRDNTDVKSNLTDEIINFIVSIEDYQWPGNVRELKNFIQNLLLLSPEGNISKEKCMEYFGAWTKKHSFLLASEKSKDDKEIIRKYENNKLSVSEYLDNFDFKETNIAKYDKVLRSIQNFIIRMLEHLFERTRDTKGEPRSLEAMSKLDNKITKTPQAYDLLKRLLKVDKNISSYKSYPLLAQIYKKAVNNRKGK